MEALFGMLTKETAISIASVILIILIIYQILHGSIYVGLGLGGVLFLIYEYEGLMKTAVKVANQAGFSVTPVGARQAAPAQLTTVTQ